MLFLQAKLRIVTIFGAGLLVGTALTVIIPEGIRALYSDLIAAQHARLHAAALGVSSNSVIVPAALASSPHIGEADGDDDHDAEYSSTIGLSLVLGKSVLR